MNDSGIMTSDDYEEIAENFMQRIENLIEESPGLDYDYAGKLFLTPEYDGEADKWLTRLIVDFEIDESGREISYFTIEGFLIGEKLEREEALRFYDALEDAFEETDELEVEIESL